MKTTFDIPDALMIRAKKRAVELRRPLRELVIEGLRTRLGEPTGHQPASSSKIAIRWVTQSGGVPPHVNLADRTDMSRWLRTES